MIVGLGTDIVSTERVLSLVERNGERFLNRWFDDGEIAYCRGKAKPHLHYAARLAAKEAAYKALRIPAGTPLCWKDIVVGKNEDGSPVLTLKGEPLAAAARLGATVLLLSLSHCDGYAVATVVAERG